jgi:exopolysaccharide biosynthesis polyprenyl glycosylphosphotransferase
VTHATEPFADEVPARAGTAPPVDRPISIHVHPEVALHQTKGGTARRHLVRGVLRVCTVAVGDAATAALAAVLVRHAAEGLASVTHVVQVPYASAFEFCGALVAALLLTGNYQRSGPHPTLTLLIGSTLGALVVSWSTLWDQPTLAAISVAVMLALLTTALLFLTRGALSTIAGRLLPEHRRLVPAIAVSSTDADDSLDQRSGYRIAGHVVLERRHDGARGQELARMIRQVRAESVIVFGSIDDAQFARLLEISLNAGCEVLCTAPGRGGAGVRPNVVWRGPTSLIQVQPPTLKAPQVIAKRCVDIVGSCIALVCAVPLFAAIAVAIRLDSPGPVFFSQERVGLGGRRFRMLKFRTMRDGAAAEKDALRHLSLSGDRRVFKIENDPRVSRVGGFLRRWSLDELPQFMNVIRGSMSLVGPRPVPEEDFIDYEEHHFRRLGAKPGITGLWQVNGRSAVSSFDEWVRLDTEYIDRWSLWMDIKILASTIPAVIRRTGAY